MAERPTVPVSVLILTRNEDQDLPGCLASLSWCDDIHVLDSLSTDATCDIARAGKATVTRRAFDGYASQRNFGLHEIVFRNDWVLMLDADERVPESLVGNIEKFLNSATDDVAAGRLCRRDYWWGRWLRHAQITPWYVRLVRPRRVRFEREINEICVVDGKILTLPGHFDHFPFSKGLDHWIAKHNTYSRMEAELIVAQGTPEYSWRLALFASDPNERRKHQKAIFFRLPARPVIKLAYMLFVRRAILDGWPGFRYALLQSIYEYFIVLKTKELRSRHAKA